jgi:hypothetical protein
MTRRQLVRPPSDEGIASLIIHHNGRKALKDADLAQLLGVTPQAMYRRIGGHLWLFSRSFMFQLAHEERASRCGPFQASLAFTKGGVIAVAALMNDERALEAGMRIAHALKMRRRSSANRKRAPPRSRIETKAAAYQKAVQSLQAEMRKILDSQ